MAVPLRSAPPRLTKPALLRAVPQRNVPLSRPASPPAKLQNNAPRLVLLRELLALQGQLEPQELAVPLVSRPTKLALLMAVPLRSAPPRLTKPALLRAVRQ